MLLGQLAPATEIGVFSRQLYIDTIQWQPVLKFLNQSISSTYYNVTVSRSTRL